MNQKLSVFRVYHSYDLAKELEQVLLKNHIAAQITNNLPSVDASFSGSLIPKQFEVKILQTDFEKAEEIVQDLAKHALNQINTNHYLYNFTDDELYNILLKPDEWNEFDYHLAQKILTERGKSIDDETLKTLKNIRLKELAQPEANQKPWIITGYILAVLGGFFGIVIGYLLWTSKKNLPNGERVFSYEKTDRNHGKNIFVIGIVFLLIFFTFKMILNIKSMFL